MKRWTSKWALTAGVYEAEFEKFDQYNSAFESGNYGSYPKSYTHDTREQAIEHAEKQRIKRIASLQRQIDKLKELKF